MSCFTTTEVAERYERYRPKVHGVVIDWLTAAAGPRRYRRALDIGCGTGDSTLPLLTIADEVEGVDSSEQMLEHARRKGLQVGLASYDRLPAKNCDLLSAGMAFHWFDRSTAVESFARASAETAVWLIYNFAFAGHPTDSRFNAWLRDWYLVRYPSPVRALATFRAQSTDSGLKELAHRTGSLTILLDRPSLIGYFTTQSNVEACVAAGGTYKDVEREIDASMPAAATREFCYAWSYTICEFGRR